MEEIIIIPAIFIGLPWIILHYITKWKTSATITGDDEALLEELYNLAKRMTGWTRSNAWSPATTPNSVPAASSTTASRTTSSCANSSS